MRPIDTIILLIFILVATIGAVLFRINHMETGHHEADDPDPSRRPSAEAPVYSGGCLQGRKRFPEGFVEAANECFAAVSGVIRGTIGSVSEPMILVSEIAGSHGDIVGSNIQPPAPTTGRNRHLKNLIGLVQFCRGIPSKSTVTVCDAAADDIIETVREIVPEITFYHLRRIDLDQWPRDRASDHSHDGAPTHALKFMFMAAPIIAKNSSSPPYSAEEIGKPNMGLLRAGLATGYTAASVKITREMTRAIGGDSDRPTPAEISGVLGRREWTSAPHSDYIQPFQGVRSSSFRRIFRAADTSTEPRPVASESLHDRIATYNLTTRQYKFHSGHARNSALGIDGCADCAILCSVMRGDRNVAHAAVRLPITPSPHGLFTHPYSDMEEVRDRIVSAEYESVLDAVLVDVKWRSAPARSGWDEYATAVAAKLAEKYPRSCDSIGLIRAMLTATRDVIEISDDCRLLPMVYYIVRVRGYGQSSASGLLADCKLAAESWTSSGGESTPATVPAFPAELSRRLAGKKVVEIGRGCTRMLAQAAEFYSQTMYVGQPAARDLSELVDIHADVVVMQPDTNALLFYWIRKHFRGVVIVGAYSPIRVPAFVYVDSSAGVGGDPPEAQLHKPVRWNICGGCVHDVAEFITGLEQPNQDNHENDRGGGARKYTKFTVAKISDRGTEIESSSSFYL